MATFIENVKALINENIKTNGVGAITGPSLNNILTRMLDCTEDVSDEAVKVNGALYSGAEEGHPVFTGTTQGAKIKPDGTEGTSQTTGGHVRSYSVEGGKSYTVSGYCPSEENTSAVFLAWYHNGMFLFADTPLFGTSVNDYRVISPSNATELKVFGNDSQPADCKGADVLSVSGAKGRRDLRGIILEPVDLEFQKAISSNGVFLDSASSTAEIRLYAITQGERYLVSGWNPSDSEKALYAFYNSSKEFISAHRLGESAPSIREVIPNIPSSASYIAVFGLGDTSVKYQEPALYLMKDTALADSVDGLMMPGNTGIIPQIYNTSITKKQSGEPIKILLFGSSWFMCTWWYLPWLLKSAGINAELHAYYMGASKFDEWISLYNGVLTPFDDTTRRATRNVSTNSDPWAVQAFGTDLTSQQYAEAFKADLEAGDWDLIAFQQGMNSTMNWPKYWGPYWSELLAIVKANCGANTHIGFNSTFTPPLQNATSMMPYPNTAEGQRQWQERNFENTKRFMALSGIYNVSPSGKALWLLRHSSHNTSNDLAGDAIHPNNGLADYTLAGAFFEAYLAPMTGVNFKDIAWKPTTSTPKALVSGNYFDAISTQAQADVKRFVRLAMANRFAL